MTVLFGRRASLNVHGKLLQGLDFEFRIDRSLKPDANTADFSIFNLSPDNRKYLQTQKGGVIVEFRAGYASDAQLSLIFLGQLREVTTLRDGSNWTTQLSTGDGDKERKHPVGFSLGPGTSFDAAVKKSLESMGVKASNLTKAISGGHFGDASKELVEGFTSFGFGGPELDKLLDSGGLEGSIQNGEMQILPKGAALNKSVVVLQESSGLVGSPELGFDKGKPTVKFRAMLNAEIAPGRLVHIVAANVDGFFRVERAAYSGQTAGGDWYVDGVGNPVRVLTKLDKPRSAEPNADNNYNALVAGNIDLRHRPYVRNADGSISTVRSISVNLDGRIYLLPTVSLTGKILSNKQAIDYFGRTHQHLGIYASEDAASAAAEAIHNDQAKNPPINTLNNGLTAEDL